MRSGTLRRRISIQNKSTIQDTFGQQITTWSDYMVNVPAQIQALTGSERLAAQALSAAVTHEITIRYSPLLSDPLKVAAMRVLYFTGGGTRNFNITAAMNVDERNEQIQLLVTEGLVTG